MRRRRGFILRRVGFTTFRRVFAPMMLSTLAYTFLKYFGTGRCLVVDRGLHCKVIRMTIIGLTVKLIEALELAQVKKAASTIPWKILGFITYLAVFSAVDIIEIDPSLSCRSSVHYPALWQHQALTTYWLSWVDLKTRVIEEPVTSTNIVYWCISEGIYINSAEL